MNITIKTIPHRNQRLEDVGDWQIKGNDIAIKISETKNFKYNSLLAIHELVEVILCKDRNISTKEVDMWDIENELRGDDPKAPYHKEHKFATKIEKLLAQELGVNWKTYDDKVMSL